MITTFMVRAARNSHAAISMLLLLTLACGIAPAATLRWTGAHGSSSDWSRGANWDTGTAPINDDILVFPAGAARLANNNDLTGLRVATIRFNGAGGGYSLSGNGVVVTDGINANNTTGNNTIALARLTLANPMSFTVAPVGFSLVIDSEVRLNGNDLTADATGFLVLRGVVSGDGNVTKTGDGLLTVNGPVGNTFTGDLRVNAGTVFLGKAAGLAVTNRLIIGDGAGGSQSDGVGMLADNQVTAVIINSSGLWNLGNFENEVSDLVLNRGGDVTTGATGKLRLGTGADITVAPGDTPGTVESSISGNLELAAGNHRVTVDNGDNTLNSSTLLIDAVISGPGGINKQGGDNLELAGANSFAGTVTVNSGTLIVNHDLALGLTTSGTRVNDSGQLRLLADVSGESLTLDSGGFGLVFPTALDVSGQQIWTGNVTLLRDSTVSVEGTIGLLDLSGVISGSGAVTKSGPGTLRFSGTGANTYVGDTYVNEGTLELDKGTVSGALAVPGRLIIGDGVGGEHADVARHLKDNQVNTVTVNGSGLWDLGTHEEEVSDLVLNDGGDVTTAATGLLRLGIGADVTATRTSNDADDHATISGNLELLVNLLGNAHTCTVVKNAGVTGSYYLDFTAVVSGTGGIVKNGNGVLILRSANTFAGSITAEAGEVAVYNPMGLGSAISGTLIHGSALLRLVFSGMVSDEALTLDTSNAIICAGDVSWSGDITVLSQSSIAVPLNSSFTASGIISGVGGITKGGAGTLTFSGNSANTYSGVTTVNEGRLALNKSGVNVSVAGDLVIGDDVGGANADVVECVAFNELDSRSAVTINSSGQFIARQESVGSIAGSGNISVSSSLIAGGNHTSTTFSGIISGAGAFNKSGLGTLTLTGNNTYTGGTGAGGGTLLINGQQPASPVLVQPYCTLGGVGRVGALSAGVGTVSPGNSPGRLTSGNVILGANAVFRVELEGPTPGATHDQLRALGTVNLGGAELQASLNFIPTLGQPLVIIDNDGTDAVVDQFNGLAEGDTLRVNQIPFVISYRGGDGNDVTLTATNRSLSLVSTRVEAGNGNGVIDPNECDHLFIALMNETGNPLAVSDVVLDSATPGVAVTQQSSEYAPFGPLDIRTNRTPFQIRTAPDFACGQPVEFLLTVSVTGGGGGTFTIPFTVPSGGAGAPVPFDNAANLNLPDLASAISTITVANAEPYVGKVAVSLYITHPSAGDLVLRLRSPSGTTVRLAHNRGGTTDNYGSGCGQANRTTFEDDAPTKIAAGAAPFIGSFAPEEPLAAFLGENPNGDWQLLISDTVTGDTGELRCWSLLLSPPDCTDGGGACESCVPALTGRFTADMPSTTTRLVRNGVPSGCGSPKACPAVITGPRFFYRVHLITNTGPETCVTAVLADFCRTSNLRLHAAGYLTSYNPADPCANYLGDTGSELAVGSTSFSFAVPQDGVIALVVSSPVSTTTCPVSYLVQLHGLTCAPPTLHIAKTGNPDEVRVFWSTAYPGFDLQSTPNLDGAAPYPFVNLPVTPVVVNGDYSVTNEASRAASYFRLRKP